MEDTERRPATSAEIAAARTHSVLGGERAPENDIRWLCRDPTGHTSLKLPVDAREVARSGGAILTGPEATDKPTAEELSREG